MELSSAIRERSSVRRFSSQPVDREHIVALVEAARWAPTAANLQAWEFIATADPAKIEAMKAVSPGMSRVPPALVAICVDRKRAHAKGGPGGETLALLDTCFAAENMLLTACDLGLGACVIRSFHQGSVARMFGCPADVVPELLVAIGYPEKDRSSKPKRRLLEEMLHFESWEATQTSGADRSHEAQVEVGVDAAPAGNSAAPGSAGEWPEGLQLQLRTALVEHLAFLASSARGLSWEPREYGPFRLMDAYSNLIGIMQASNLATPELARIRELIEANKLSVMDEPERFNQLIDRVLDALVKQL